MIMNKNPLIEFKYQGGYKMNFLLIFIIVTVILGYALVGTLLITKDSDSKYSGNKSISDQVLIYFASIPVLAIFAILYWIFTK